MPQSFMRTHPTALLASVGAVGTAGLVGASYGPQTPRNALWYALLRKPRGTPPGPVIGIVWTVLEGLLCMTGARLMAAPANPARNTALLGWWGTVGGLALFPKLFFDKKRLDASLAASAGMLVAASASAAFARPVDKTASAGMVPVVAWLGLATLLSAALWRKN